MFRFLAWLMKWEDFETCKSCQTLKEQLEFERRVNENLVETLLKIVKPEPVVADRVNLPENTQILKGAQTFSRRRAALELKDRLAAQIEKSSNIIAKSDDEILKVTKHDNSKMMKTKTIPELEKELGVEQNG